MLGKNEKSTETWAKTILRQNSKMTYYDNCKRRYDNCERVSGQLKSNLKFLKSFGQPFKNFQTTFQKHSKNFPNIIHVRTSGFI